MLQVGSEEMIATLLAGEDDRSEDGRAVPGGANESGPLRAGLAVAALETGQAHERSEFRTAAATYVWGVNSVGNIYKCQSPCTGAWSQVDGGLKQADVGDVEVCSVDRAGVHTRAAAAQAVFAVGDSAGASRPSSRPSKMRSCATSSVRNSSPRVATT